MHMGYDGGFTKVRMKLTNQKMVDTYGTKLRNDIYNCLGQDSFYSFESGAVELDFLDQSWSQVHCLRTAMNPEEIRDYDADPNPFTLITKDILRKFIDEAIKTFEVFLEEYGEDEENQDLRNDIELLESLYINFDWENDTLLFSYSY